MVPDHISLQLRSDELDHIVRWSGLAFCFGLHNLLDTMWGGVLAMSSYHAPEQVCTARHKTHSGDYVYMCHVAKSVNILYVGYPLCSRAISADLHGSILLGNGLSKLGHRVCSQCGHQTCVPIWLFPSQKFNQDHIATTFMVSTTL